MKRTIPIAAALLALAACQDSTMPVQGGQEPGQPNIGVTDPSVRYGFVDGHFAFLTPLVENSTILGNQLNTNLKPWIELWERGSASGACEGTKKAEFEPQPNSDSTYYVYNWKTSDPALTTGTVYRLCVKVELASGERIVGWRDIQPDKSTGSNNPAGMPYLFQNGSNIPIKFWMSRKIACTDLDGDGAPDGDVIDCTIVTFGASGGTAYCDNPQCGMDFPAGLLGPDSLITFELRYIKCPVYNIVNNDTVSVEYLDIDIPQYYGCLNVTAYANFNWAGFQGGSTSGIVFAACRDTDLPNIDNDRVLLHIESHQVASDGRKVVYSLPTRPFTLDCDQTSLVQAPGADGSIGDWARYYAARGAQAFKRTLLPFVDPPELVASHAGFGGGSSSGCDAAVSSADGSTRAPTCSTPSLAAGATTAGLVMSPVYEYRAVWALPSMVDRRLRVDANGNDLGDWVDPLSTAGGAVYPAVRVVNVVECVDPSTDEDCTSSTKQNVVGAKVTFRDLAGNVIGTAKSGDNGIASVQWAVPSTAGLYTATASGLGIGVDPSLASVTLSPPPAVGTYQDHIGNYAVPLLAPKVKFEASVCSDKSFVLSQPGVETSAYGMPYKIPINISGSSADAAELYVTSDCYNAYFALVVPLSQDLQNSLRIVFVDSLETGWSSGWNPASPSQWFSTVPVIGDDMWMIYKDANKKNATYGKWLVEDWHVSNDCTGSNKQSECGAKDAQQNLISPTFAQYGAVTQVGNSTVYEFARSYASQDPEDFYLPAVGGETWIGFYLVLQMGSGAQGNTEYPDFRVFQPVKIQRQ